MLATENKTLNIRIAIHLSNNMNAKAIFNLMGFLLLFSFIGKVISASEKKPHQKGVLEAKRCVVTKINKKCRAVEINRLNRRKDSKITHIKC